MVGAEAVGPAVLAVAGGVAVLHVREWFRRRRQPVLEYRYHNCDNPYCRKPFKMAQRPLGRAPEPGRVRSFCSSSCVDRALAE